MAKTGKVIGGHVIDNADRVSSEGKNGLIVETIDIPTSGAAVTIYNRNMTAYTAVPTDITTGAAILAKVKHALYVGAIHKMVTGAPTTTTAFRPPVVKIINGPTTVAVVYALGGPAAGGSGVSIIVFGKDF